MNASAPWLSFSAHDPRKVDPRHSFDVTEFHVAGEKLLLSPIMELFNREIIAYETSKKPVQLVDGMLRQAVSRLRSKDKPVLHSDQGWQYQMRSYQRTLRKHGVAQSMSRKGNCLDNAAMESFFGTLETEFFYLQKFNSSDELQKGLHTYIRHYDHDGSSNQRGSLQQGPSFFEVPHTTLRAVAADLRSALST